MVVFTLLLNRAHVFAIFILSLNRETWQLKGQSIVLRNLEDYLGPLLGGECWTCMKATSLLISDEGAQCAMGSFGVGAPC